MGVAVIIGLVVAVISLTIVYFQQNKTIKTYEKELTKKARKGKK